MCVGRRHARVEARQLLADRRPPRLGHRRVAPAGRVGVPARVRRDDERPVRPERVEQPLDDRLRAAADPAERGHRRVHEQHAPGPHAEPAEVRRHARAGDRSGARADPFELFCHRRHPATSWRAAGRRRRLRRAAPRSASGGRRDREPDRLGAGLLEPLARGVAQVDAPAARLQPLRHVDALARAARDAMLRAPPLLAARCWNTTNALPRSFAAACAFARLTPPVTRTVNGSSCSSPSVAAVLTFGSLRTL